MSYSVRFTARAHEDLLRLVACLAERDPAAAAHAGAAIGEAVSLLNRFPLSRARWPPSRIRKTLKALTRPHMRRSNRGTRAYDHCKGVHTSGGTRRLVGR